MRTPEEITKDIETLRTEAIDHIDGELEKANKCMADRLVNGPEEDKWLVKQYHGHLVMIYHMSTQQPLPIEATKTALEGLKCLAVTIERLGWVDGNSFVLVADDMMRHFVDVMRLKDELTKATPEAIDSIFQGLGMDKEGPGKDATVH